jgi:hypothetical protein
VFDVTARTLDGHTTVTITHRHDQTRQATYERQGAEALAAALESLRGYPADLVPALDLIDADYKPLAQGIRDAIAASERAPRRRWH